MKKESQTEQVEVTETLKPPPRQPDLRLLTVREDRGPKNIPLPGWLKNLAAKL